MFYDRLSELCKQNGTTVTELLKTLQLSTSKGTAWKNGSIPSGGILSLIADHFGVSTDYLLGRDPNIEKSSAENTAELEELLKSPHLRETYEKLVRMNPEELELVNAQIDLILKIRDKNSADDARPE